VLFDGSVVSGVIDIEAIGSGARAFDYATLLDHDDLDEDVLALLVGAGGNAAGPDVLRVCLARVVLDLVRFMSEQRAPGADDRLAARTLELRERVVAVDRLLARRH
jgi:hypothetical protein